MERIIELIIDEENEFSGIEAISVVENPAIEEDFIALKEHKEVKLAEVDKEKRILMGAALIPNKKIYRNSGEEEYYIFFAEETVRKASELFLMKGNQNNSTLEHDVELEGMSVVESWIIEDETKDKSRKYNFDLPVGTWMVSVKVNNDDIWNQVKAGEIKGFSIEGYFADKMDSPKESVQESFCSECLDELNAEYDLLEAIDLLSEEVHLESYGGYPESASNNAKLGIKRNKELGNKCATLVGKTRARQLERKEKFTLPTLKRIYSYLSRAAEYYDPSKPEACGTISYLLWGGKSMLNWTESKLKGLEASATIIDGRAAYSTMEEAEEAAKDIGCSGYHTHDVEGKTWYMPCESHNLAEVGPKGGIKSSPKAPKSGTKNPNPKGKGSAKGDASGKTGAKVSAKDRATLQNKANDFNKRYKEKLGYGATVGALASVFQRGLGAFNTSRSPRVKSASQWAFARVNAFLYLLKNGRPQNPKYTTDYDLLPNKHPKSSKK
tara:strand:- start:599 stop:2086 length:1488 start_codon:yes stop_codon:yes gene_type:complete